LSLLEWDDSSSRGSRSNTSHGTNRSASQDTFDSHVPRQPGVAQPVTVVATTRRGSKRGSSSGADAYSFLPATVAASSGRSRGDGAA
jgi:hypothetical protein